MGQFGKDDDKDFVLSSSYQDNETLESRDDLYHGSSSNTSSGQTFKPVYIAVGGFLILIVLSVVVIARTYSLAEKVQLLALESRLEQLESRLGSIEGEGGLSQTAGQGNPLILLTERLDQLEANMTARINSMANQLQSASAKPVGEATAETEAAAPAPAIKEEAKAKIHTVKPGETLYRISRRYDLSVEQLRQYNQLDQKASIYPGQKLRLSSPQ
jgi:LysM repeat protein